MVGEWIADLVDAELIEPAGTTASRGGRPAQQVKLAGDAAFTVGIDLSGWPVRVAVSDLAAQVRFQAALEKRQVRGEHRANGSSEIGPLAEDRKVTVLPPTTPADVIRVARWAMQHANVPRERIRAVGVGLAGFVDTRRGVHRPEAVPGAVAFPLAAPVSAELGIPVVIEDTARAAALAEARGGAAAGTADVLFLSLGDRIGAALILDGILYRGAAGVAGELGHVVVKENGARCTCGNYGCLQTLASRGAILQQARNARTGDGGPTTTTDSSSTLATLDMVAEAAARGDGFAATALRRAGQSVGQVLAGAANLLGPTMIVLGGYAPGLGDVFLNEVGRALESAVVPPVRERMSVTVSSLGVNAASVGAAWGAIDLLVDSGALVQGPDRRRLRRSRKPADNRGGSRASPAAG